MPRKLKTYQTAQGFFDLAIATPSMKAALEAWDSNLNLFHKGLAREVDDSDVIAATLAKPGVVLQRPVGTNEPFVEHAHLPKTLPPTDTRRDKPLKRLKPAKQPRSAETDDKTARKAALAYEEERQRREREQQKQEAARAQEREKRERAIEKAQAQFDEARREHEQVMDAIERERAALDKRQEAEEGRWEKAKHKLEGTLRRGRG
jgi:colicin import membrane protein